MKAPRPAPPVTALVMHEHKWAVSFWRAASYSHDERTARFVRNLD